MRDSIGVPSVTLSIAAVERDTGLSKDTLRVWERRYGFPLPHRDALGERSYPLAQVEKLRAIKRLLDAGHRPGRIVPLPVAELQALTDSTVGQTTRNVEVALAGTDLHARLDLIRQHDPRALRDEMNRLLMRFGLGRFVIEVVAPLNVAVGDAWMRGQLEIFEEHLYTETMQSVLRQALASIPPPPGNGRPGVLLSTLPGEPHSLGLLMAEVILALEGCRCISLGTQTPLWDVALAARACAVDVVALGFTGCINPNHVVDNLTELRSKLPPSMAIWAGGTAPVLHRRPVEGVTPLASLDLIPAELRRWR
jgi:DNA-binding transcriptional MerR regulator